MKKSIFTFLAVLTVFAMVMTGCPEENVKKTKVITKVTLDQTDFTVENGKTGRINATTDPADVELEWTSSAEGVVNVNSVGIVTGMSVGTAEITAKAEDGGKATCTVTVTASLTSDEDVKVVGETLEHYTAKLVGVNHFGDNLGTNNADGSYTFDGTAEAWKGGGAQYTFPAAKKDDTWSVSNYDLVEVQLKVTGGSVQVKSAKYGNNNDLLPYPTGTQNITLDSTVNNGVYKIKFVITDAGYGIGFQRNTGGPATVKIEKVIFSKVTEFTVSFDGGGAPITIPPSKVLTDRKITLPYKPKWEGHTFLGWYDGNNLFDADNTPITKDLTLTAKWSNVAPVPVDMKLNLDPSTWGTLPDHPNVANPDAIKSGGWPWPTNYAETAYEDGKLKITFDGNNRQRAIIPLNEDQIYELLNPELTGATFKIVGTVSKGTQGTLTNAQLPAGTLGFAAFRLHLADPAVSSNWNGTDTGKQTPLTGNSNAEDDHLIEYNAFSSNKKAATLGYFVIQAMFLNSAKSDTIQTGFPKVIITIESITIEGGNTKE
jgi:uncharacterized repeat protein (TIGR02543 family)